nr:MULTISPECIES: general stress protein [unclassified Nocardia]
MSESGRGTFAIGPHQPARQVIATFDDYADAESAGDSRSDQHFAVDEPAIDRHDIEQVVGRSNYRRAALRGAAAGGLIGAFFGWIFALGGRRDFTSTQPSQPRHYEVLADVEVADEPCACSSAGPIERNEPWRPL